MKLNMLYQEGKNYMRKLNYVGKIKQGIPTILFIPGTMISPEIYINVTVPKGYQAIKISWIDSPCNNELYDVAKSIVDFIKENDLKKVILAGYSSGGMISMLTYLEDKSNISGLLLSNTGANVVNQTDTSLPDRIRSNWTEEDTIGFINRCFYKPLDKEMFKILLEYANRISKEDFLKPVLSVRKIDIADRLHEIDCPVIIAHGKHDRVRGVIHAEQLHKGIKNSEVILLDSGHSPMYEDSENYTKALKTLVEKI